MRLWPRPRTVALAIDDGPSAMTAQLLATLERGGHRAVLFVLGGHVAGREAVLVEAIRRGFALGNHSFSHPRFSTLGIGEARREIAATETLIGALYGTAGVRRPGKWFRFPYLDTGGAAAEAMQDLLGEFGFEPPRAFLQPGNGRDWATTIDPRDWTLPDEAAFRAALGQARPGDVIELHDKPETVPRYAAAVVAGLAALGLRGAVPRC